MSDFAKRISAFSRARLELLCTELKERLERQEGSRPEDVAIVGMACRFPGGVSTPEAFWELLQGGVDAIEEIPPDRWDVEAFYDPDPDKPGKTYSRHGGFLRDVAGFDPAFFNISPREAVSLDPQYRLLLEVTWEALERAGQNPHELKGTRTGVFMGVGADDYAKIQVRLADPDAITAYTGTGNAYCYGVGRLSYFLGLQGPNFPVDTACSSSLVVTHLACQSLRAGECDLALAGGVHLMLSPVGTVFLSKARALAPDGRCKAFDAGADGFSRGEGCGVVVLRRLSDARVRRDRIHAVIRGSAINHDGPSSGFTVPNGPAQQAVVQAALRAAQADPREVGYVEAHGTGTSLGDPIEVRGLAATLGRRAGRGADQPLVIGSVKANIGHLEAAAGVAGLIKTVLALEHELVPPHLHLRRVNPQIPLEEGPFVIPTRAVPWPRSARSRLAGVSSFGLSGTNAHVVVQEAPPRSAAPAGVERPLHVFTLSARTESALRALATRFERHLADGPGEQLADICFTTNCGRAHFTHRLAMVAGSANEVRAQLQGTAGSGWPPAVASGKVERGKRPRLAFLFSGEDSFAARMGESLYRTEPRFRDAIHECDAALASCLDRPVSRLLYSDEGAALLQPPPARDAALFAFEYALLQLWRAWGVQPAAVLGHGLGEYVAAVAAGVMGLEEALRVVVERARVAHSLGIERHRAILSAKAGNLGSALSALPDGVKVVAVNSPAHAAVVGPPGELEQMREQLRSERIRVRPVSVDGGLYSAAALAIRGRLEAALDGVRLRPPQVPMVSSLSGDWVSDEAARPSHWAAQATRPVQFSSAIAALAGRGYDHLLEIGPMPMLAFWGRRCLPDERLNWHASLRPHEEWAQILSSLSLLHVAGLPIDWAGFDRPYARERVPLPTYPFERQRYWLELSHPVRPLTVVPEDEAMMDAATGATLRRLLRVWGGDGAQAVNRRVSAPLVFLSSSAQSFFYMNQSGSSMVIPEFVGPPESFDPAVRELLDYARARTLEPVFIVQERHAARLRTLGFATTPVGVWQSIPDLRSFSIEAEGMRRLRSKLNSYRNGGPGVTEEYRPGGEPATDRRIVELIDAWVTRKKRKAPFLALLTDWIIRGRVPAGYRTFLTRRGDVIDSFILLSPIEARNGVLLDQEFYAGDMPAGCLEFSIVNTIKQLKDEGISYYSLGSTFSAHLDPDPAEDPRVREILRTNQDRGVLNDPGNVAFKKKFNPSTVRLYLCSLANADLSAVPDTLMMLSAPDRIPRGPVPWAAAAGQAQPGAVEGSPSRVLGPSGERRPPASHPLLGERIPLASADVVFESRLDPSARESSWLADHRVLERVVVPAAGYIEMGLAAAGALLPGRGHALRDLSFVEALDLADHESRAVQLVYGQDGAGGGSFRIFSRREGAGPSAAGWTLHAMGVLSTDAGPGTAALSLQELRGKGLPARAVETYYAQMAEFGLNYGSSFRALRELWAGHGEALARIEPPPQVARDPGKYHVHPVLLDACLQVQGAALLASRGETEGAVVYLPAAIEQVRVYGKLDAELWAHCQLRPVAGADRQQIVGDLRVWSAGGELAAEIEGLAVRSTSREVLQELMQRNQEKVLYQVEWRPHARERRPPAPVPASPRRWMVFADTMGTADRLLALLQEQGEEAVVVHAGETLETEATGGWRVDPSRPEHFERVLEASAPLHRVVYLWSAAAPPSPPLDLAWLRRSQRLGCQGLFHLVRALAAAGARGSRRQLWVVTRAAQPSSGATTDVDPSQAPVWGLGRTISQEHPELWGGMIDLDSEAADADAVRLLEEIGDPDDEDHLALRAGERYVARLVGRQQRQPALPLRLDGEAMYMITGGLGGLGLTVARWMVGRGARHLLLTGRKPASQQGREALAELRRAGAEEARYVQADVSRREDVVRLLGEAARERPPLRGIVHAAGVLADGTLLQQSWPRFLEVMAPKVEGAWHLHDLAPTAGLDHFVLFSSSASILGAAGQGNYAAANAFMDALAHHRRARGLPALSINWGPWDEVGMSAALDPRAKAQRASQGIRPLSPVEGTRLMEQAMTSGWSQIGIISVAWEQLLKGGAAVLRHSSVFKELLALAADAGDAGGAGSPVVAELLAGRPEGRQERIRAFVANRVARILGLEPEALDLEEPLTSQGFDSLMALELRERMETELQITIPILTFFRSNSVAAFAKFVLEELATKHGGLAYEPGQEESPRALLARLDQLSDAEVEAALRRELGDTEDLA